MFIFAFKVLHFECIQAYHLGDLGKRVASEPGFGCHVRSHHGESKVPTPRGLESNKVAENFFDPGPAMCAGRCARWLWFSGRNSASIALIVAPVATLEEAT